MALGREGYLLHAEQVMQVAAAIKAGVQRIEGLKVLGPAEAMIVCFTGIRDCFR
jgi:glutamate/tyrosine decarboxylase-like PLP-dependent enzyme